jgi:hypothetical protein
MQAGTCCCPAPEDWADSFIIIYLLRLNMHTTVVVVPCHKNEMGGCNLARSLEEGNKNPPQQI